jgi:uncharacterized protein
LEFVMGVVHYLSDGLRNLVANLGTARDKASSSFHYVDELNPAQLIAAYRGAWLPRKIVDIPAFDACREWRLWTGSQQQIEALEKQETALNVKGKVREAITSARLYGGCAIFIGTGETDLMAPLDVERVGKGGLKYLTVVPRYHISGGNQDLDPESEWFGKPSHWQMNDGRGSLLQVHPSRLVIFIGAPLPAMDASATLGWGDSILTAVYSAVTQADATTANISSLVFEAKIDVISVPNLQQNLNTNPQYENAILKRFQLAAVGKGNNGTLILDGEEKYDQKTTSFATLPDIMDRFYQNVSGAADIPMTRLFGRSPAGLNATGDADLRNYYDRISAMQELEMEPAMARLDECLIKSALGTRPPEVHVEWAPLWQSSEKEKADIGKVISDTAKQLSDMQLYTPEALAEATMNALVEAGAMTGLEGAVDRYGSMMHAENYLMQAAAATVSPASFSAQDAFRKRLIDAAPKVEDIKPDQLESVTDSLERVLKAMPAHTFNVDVKTPDVKVEQAPITVTAPAVTIEPTQITVNVPDYVAPPVNVTVQPAQVTAGDVKVDVHMPKAGMTDTTVEEGPDQAHPSKAC